MRPIVHTFSSFLVERAFEQIKLGFGHQDVGGVLVGAGGSFDVSSGGRTHQSPGDVALLDTIPGIQIHAPGTAVEVDAALRASVAGDGLHYVRVVNQTNEQTYPHTPGRFHVVRRGAGATVIALGPVLEAVLEATVGRDMTVLYANTVRPFDGRGLRVALGSPEVVLVEPWLAGTSAHLVSAALRDVPHRLLALGVGRSEHRRYGTPAEHVAAHGLDASGIRASLDGFLPCDDQAGRGIRGPARRSLPLSQCGLTMAWQHGLTLPRRADSPRGSTDRRGSLTPQPRSDGPGDRS